MEITREELLEQTERVVDSTSEGNPTKKRKVTKSMKSEKSKKSEARLLAAKSRAKQMFNEGENRIFYATLDLILPLQFQNPGKPLSNKKLKC